MIADLTPAQAAKRLAEDDPPLLVDVREPWERDRASIAGAVSIPLGELPARLDDLPRDRDIILHCHHGARSLQAAGWLHSRGFARVANLAGGIDAWSRDVDPSVPTY